MLIATPDETSAFVTIQALSSEWGLMRSAFLKRISAVIRERVSAYSESCSPRRRWASSQSRTAVQFAMISAHPDASRRWGADAMISVSATTAMGGSAESETFPSAVGTEALDEAMPS